MEYSVDESKQTITIGKTCTVTGKLYSVVVDKERFQAWRNGALVQRVFPELSSDEREFLINRLTPAEWKKVNHEP